MKVLVPLFLSFMYPSLYAQESSTADSQKLTKEANKEVAQPLGSSASARRAGSGGVEMGYGGVAGAISGTQLHGYYAITSNLNVGLTYSSGEEDFKDELSNDVFFKKVHEASASAEVAAITARYFFGNSFYVNGGLGQRKVSLALDVESELLDYRARGKIETNSVVALIGIGNQWQWDNGFSLGCEWIGASIPLTSSNSGEYKELSRNGTALADDSAEEANDDISEVARDLGKATLGRALMLSAGWAF